MEAIAFSVIRPDRVVRSRARWSAVTNDARVRRVIAVAYALLTVKDWAMAIRGLRAFNSVRLWRYLEVLRHATEEADSLKALERGWEFLAARSLGVRELY